MTGNRLGAASSPYLRQHKDNPVQWWEWGPEALAAARDADKPILLSIGYAACHWCHVMAHESFEDPAIAAVMNRHFINIKVDREERPDIDHIYMTALHAMGQPGGWPLTMFLAPDGAPFWGGTYFPPVPRHGQPAFPQILERLAKAYEEREPAVAQNREALTGRVRQLMEQTVPGSLNPDAMVEAARFLAGHLDPVHGGIGDAPKFPNVPALTLLWHGHYRTADTGLAAAWGAQVEKALTHMAQGGIYDHLGGGFARYSVDAAWRVPHFEKMLYDNALLIDLMTAVWRAGKNPLFAQRVAETVAWLEREMLLDNGAFAASLDADSDGEEGKYYVWREKEVDIVLGPNATLFKAVYDVRAEGHWEGKTILNRLHRLALGAPEEEAALALARARLLARRAQRSAPARDDKLIADWNGLAIAALAQAAMSFAEPAWLGLAERAFAGVLDWLGDGPRLTHAGRDGKVSANGLLDDHAAMGLAALSLYQATGNKAYLAKAEVWAKEIEARFAAKGGGYYLTPSDGETLLARPRLGQDQASPSGNAMTSKLLVCLYYFTGKEGYAKRAQALFESFAGDAARNPLAFASLLAAHDAFVHPVEVLIAGSDGLPAQALEQAVWRALPPNALVRRARAADDLPPGHPARGLVQETPQVLICRGRACSLPLGDPAAVTEALGGE
ncbi:MAG: thioredoxin domain-containing protein [Pseudomonadota bacterium]